MIGFLHMSFARRLLSNTVVNGVGIGFAAVMQLLSVPVLTLQWGVTTYGVWLLITTIPAYFALSDLGFASAATSSMTIAVAQGKRDDAVETFQSLVGLQSIICLALICLAAPLIWIDDFPQYRPLAIEGLGPSIFILVVYSALVLACRTVLAALRSTGFYSAGTIIHDTLVFVEGAAVLVGAAMGFGVPFCCWILLIVRVLIFGVLNIVLTYFVPWLHYGCTHGSLGRVRSLSRPAFAAVTIPFMLALNIQGMVLIVGWLISPAAVAVLASVRTISRISIQVVGVANRASMPELSAAYAKNDVVSRNRILKINIALIVFCLLPGCALFAVFGKTVVEHWTQGKIIPDQNFIFLMAAATALQGLWYFASNLLVATNNHVGFSKVLALSAVGAFMVALGLGQIAGLSGVASGILIGELIALVGIYRSRFYLGFR